MSYRAYLSTVSRIQQLSPHFTRFTFTSPDMHQFGTTGLDQRIKLLFPLADGSYTDIGLFDEPTPSVMQWYQAWRELPNEKRNPMRTYTVRAVRPEAAEIDVDVVLHGTEGPASAWASSAQVGDVLIINGPQQTEEAETGGVEWKPGTARSVMLAGDETAAPAICAIVESLDESYSGHAFIEVPTMEDALEVPTRSAVQVHWLSRDGGDHGVQLDPAVRAWGQERAQGNTGETVEEPSADEILWEVADAENATEYAWLAGEAGVITTLRRHLVRDLGIDRHTITFMGYWRKGRAES